jgi:hypothetical protein
VSRFAFSLLHAGYMRNYSSVVALLCERGHAVHIALTFDEKRPGDGELLRRLARSHPTFSYGPAPQRSRFDPWRRTARLVRQVTDLVRYSHPDYAGAMLLRTRGVRKMGLSRPFRRLATSLTATASAEATDRRLAALRGVEEAIPPSRQIIEWLDAQQADVVLASPVVEFGSPQVDFLKSARAAQLPTGVCVASWDNLTNKGLLRFAADRILVWNELQRAEAVRYHAVAAESVVTTGAPRFDRWFGRTPSTGRDEFLSRVGLAPGKYVLFLGSSPFIAPDEVRFVERWLAALRDGGLDDVGVLVRPHPQNAPQWRGVELSRFGNVAITPDLGEYPDFEEAERGFYDSIAHSSGVVGVNTSALIESAIVGRAVYTILDNETSRAQVETLHFDYLRANNGGFLIEATSLDEHVRQLSEGLTHPDSQAADRAQEFVERFVRPLGVDRSAALAMADALEALAAVAPAPAPPPRREFLRRAGQAVAAIASND